MAEKFLMSSLGISDDLFLFNAHFYDFLAFHISQIIPLFCSTTPHFRNKNFLTTFLGFYPQILHFISRKFWWLFLVINLFSALLYFTDDDSYFLFFAHYIYTIQYSIHPLYTHACCFSRFCTLLCALVTVNTEYTIYFFLIHHCTNSLSSLYIFVITAHFLHHCTLKQALQKTMLNQWLHHTIHILNQTLNLRGVVTTTPLNL